MCGVAACTGTPFWLGLGFVIMLRCAMQEGLLELIQFCDLMVTGRLEDVLNGEKRGALYAHVDMRRLLVLLRKFRCGTQHSASQCRAGTPAEMLDQRWP